MGIVCPAGVRARIERSCGQVIHVAAFDLDGTILDGESPLKLTTSLLRHRELPLHKGVLMGVCGIKYRLRLPQTESATVQGAPDGNEPFLVTEKMPSFRSGEIKDFRNWIQMHIQYPAEAMKNNIQGRVIVSFIVEKDGSVSNILVLQSPDKLLADEARRVIASSPAGAWTPGEQRGEKVRVKYTLPVDFYLQGSGDKLSERPEKPQGSLDGILVVGYGATSK